MLTIEATIDEQGHVHWSEHILLKKAQRVLITFLPDEMFSSESSKSAREILEETGFIGFGEASPDSSENYKAELFDLSDKKYDNRGHRVLVGFDKFQRQISFSVKTSFAWFKAA